MPFMTSSFRHFQSKKVDFTCISLIFFFLNLRYPKRTNIVLVKAATPMYQRRTGKKENATRRIKARIIFDVTFQEMFDIQSVAIVKRYLAIPETIC